MKIVIVGSGNVGSAIVKQLSSENHNITIVDINEQAVRKICDSFDVMGIVGNGVSLGALKEAGVSEADLLIAVTDSDERNLLTCLLAKKAGASHTIARVRDPEYRDEMEFIRGDLGLSMFVNPELAAAGEIARLLKFPSAIEIDSFARGRVEILKFQVTKESPLCGVALKNLSKTLNTNVLVCMVERGGQVVIPKGDFTLWEDDKVSFVAPSREAQRFFKAVGINQGRAKDTIIVGGGDIAFYLARMLEETGVHVKIIDKAKERCNELAEKLPKAVIINGDGQEKALLGEEGIEHTDSFVTLTNFDEANVMMSIYARKVNPGVKLVTKVHRSTYDDIIDDMNIGSIINPKILAAQQVVKYVRGMDNSRGSNIETLYKLYGGGVEALEFRVGENPELTGKPLMELNIKPDVLVCCIIHNGVVEIPGGKSRIYRGDKVIVVTTETGFVDISDILEK